MANTIYSLFKRKKIEEVSRLDKLVGCLTTKERKSEYTTKKNFNKVKEYIINFKYNFPKYKNSNWAEISQVSFCLLDTVNFDNDILKMIFEMQNNNISELLQYKLKSSSYNALENCLILIKEIYSKGNNDLINDKFIVKYIIDKISTSDDYERDKLIKELNTLNCHEDIKNYIKLISL